MSRLGRWLRRIRTWLLSGRRIPEPRLSSEQQQELFRDGWFRPR